MNPERFTAEQPEQIIRRSLDEVTVIYHRASGQSHLVASPVPEILDALTNNVLSVDDLFAALAEAYDLGDAQDARTELSGHIDQLTAIGLIRAT
jgi:PqqD family protein of HPr-rel-A system